MLGQIQAHGECVLSLSSAGPVIASGALDGDVGLWSLSDGSKIAYVNKAHTQGTNEVVLMGDTLLRTSGDDRCVKFWDLRNLTQPVHLVSGFTDGVNRTTIDHEGRLIAGCDDGQVYVYNLTATVSGCL